MSTELKQLIEDAAKLLGIRDYNWLGDGSFWVGPYDGGFEFNPLDPNRGDLMKVAEAAELEINYADCTVWEYPTISPPNRFTKGDYQSQAIAVLRAASAVLKARGE